MPTEQAEEIQQFALEGPLSVGPALSLCLVMAVIFAWSMWREARFAPRRLVFVFWLLRLTVLATVSWMLLGPTQLTVHRKATHKTVALLADASQSMHVVDPPREFDDARWFQALHRNEDSSLGVACDRAQLATSVASSQYQQVLTAIERDRRGEAVKSAIEIVNKAARRALEHINVVRDQVGSSGNETQSLLSRIQQSLEARILPELTELMQQLDTTVPVLDQNLLARARALAPQLNRVARQTERLSNGPVRQQAALNNPQSSDRQTVQSLSRLEKVAQVLESAEHSWLIPKAGTLRIKRYGFAESAFPVSSATWSAALADDETSDQPARTGDEPSATSIASALEQVGRDAGTEMIEAAIVLTDGRHNSQSGRDPRDVAASFGNLPVHIVPVGNPDSVRDVSLHHVDAPSTVVANDLMVIQALVSASKCEGETLAVELFEQGQLIDRKEIEVTAERSDHRIEFTLKAEVIGQHSYELQVEPVEGEFAADNNMAPFGVSVVEDSLRVLLADNLPRWEFRYLVHLFTRDEHIDFDQLVFNPEVSGSGALQANPRFPRQADGWSRYRVVILGDLSPEQLDSEGQQSLKEYVTRRGGTLILIAGRSGMPQTFAGQPLATLLPVEPADTEIDLNQGITLELTSEGRQNDAIRVADDEIASAQIWREMSRASPMYFLSEFSQPKSASRTLIRAVPVTAASSERNERAFLCWQWVGRGRVVYLSAPATYRLRLRQGDRYHHRFWGQLIRWAVARELAIGSKTVRINTDKTRYAVGEQIRVIAQLTRLNGDAYSSADLHATASRNQEMIATIDLTEDDAIPGRYLGQLEKLTAGPLRIQVAGPEVDELLQEEQATDPVETSIVIEPAKSIEMRDTRSNPSLLAQIAELTGGHLLPPTALSEVLELTDLAPKITEETTRSPLWNRWTYLWIVFFCLSTEWILRKRIGLA